ncbi:hypothetical protein CRH12_11520 [Coxiella burnetii]|nr:hypothetical protein CRH12_11520 [Coxiella burnetii]
MLPVQLLWVFAASGESECPCLWKSLRRVRRVAELVWKLPRTSAVLLVGAGPAASMAVISLRALVFLV